MSGVDSLMQNIDDVRQDPLNIELYLARGIDWFNLKCYDECCSDLMLYEAMGGENPEFNKYLGMGLSKTQSKRSTVYLRAYLKAKPDDVDAMVYLGHVYYDVGEYYLSAEMFHKAADKGYDPSIIREKAASLAAQKMYDEAAAFDPAFGKKRGLFRR